MVAGVYLCYVSRYVTASTVEVYNRVPFSSRLDLPCMRYRVVLGVNRLTGSVPSELGKLSALTLLDFSM